MRSSVERDAFRNMEPKQRGMGFEGDVKGTVLGALIKYDPESRVGTDIENRHRGTDFIGAGVPIDVTINTGKPGKIIHKTHQPPISASSMNGQTGLAYAIRLNNGYVRNGKTLDFDIPVLVIEFDTGYMAPDGTKMTGRDKDMLVSDVLDRQMPGIIEKGFKFYKDKTGYDMKNLDHFFERDEAIQSALEKDKAQPQRQRNAPRVGIPTAPRAQRNGQIQSSYEGYGQ